MSRKTDAMLFILTGEIQSGKTRWLSCLVEKLGVEGVACFGVLSPGVWNKGTDGSFEKVGIETVLLPSFQRFPFACRRDLVEEESKLLLCSQSEQGKLGWAISDDAIEVVNNHFRKCHKAEEREKDIFVQAESGVKKNFLIVDELGRLELSRGQGFTEALRILEMRRSFFCDHALVVVRKGLEDQALRALRHAWDEVCVVHPDDTSWEFIVGTVA